MYVCFIDEMDAFISGVNTLLKTLFTWATAEKSKIVLLGAGNTITFPGTQY
jgi:hypothetical protein